MFYDYEYDRDLGEWTCQDDEGYYGVGNTKRDAWVNLQEIRMDVGESVDSRYDRSLGERFVSSEKPMDRVVEDYKWDNRL